MVRYAAVTDAQWSPAELRRECQSPACRGPLYYSAALLGDMPP
jgi:hypothetical protein